MSLLIKALQKVERNKAADGESGASYDELSYPLSDSGVTLESPAGLDQQRNSQQVAAGLVFSAKNSPNHRDADRAYLFAGLGLMLLLLLGGGFYYYQNKLQQPELLPPKAAPVQTAIPVAAELAPVIAEDVTSKTETVSVDSVQNPPKADKPTVTKTELINEPSMKVSEISPAPAKQQRHDHQSVQRDAGKSVASTDSAVKVTRNAAITGVNPTLLSAYQALNSGSNVAAQRLYREVLQSDARNVDALLGMAAIAARQGRDMDAAGWYGKVLEVEPRNPIAQSALIGTLTQADPVSGESRVKSLLAQQPESADLYAALGNLYAEQNQWPSAQQAFFQAHHFDPDNANYAYNLAISLDQLGKSQLALQFYKETLALLAKSKTGGIDQAQLEHRIQQLQ
jgi:tetratricopeptide (TPR) repeat protein